MAPSLAAQPPILLILQIFLLGRRIFPVRDAWIGFSGTIIGSLIAVIVATVALEPTFRQAQESQRTSAVAAGQILRSRFKAAQSEQAILKKGNTVEKIPLMLLLDQDDIDRDKWLANRPDRAKEIFNSIIPDLVDIAENLNISQNGVELPELDRSDFIDATNLLVDQLRRVLDGQLRFANGAMGPIMSPEEWRSHMLATADYANKYWPEVRSKFKEKLNFSVKCLRKIIVRTDKIAMNNDAMENSLDRISDNLICTDK